MPPSTVPPPPDATSLHQAALNYLARYSATEAGLRRVLIRRIDRWAATQADRDMAGPVVASAKSAVDGIVQKLVRGGAVSDAGFAEMRARSLLHAGRSSRAIQASLVAKGISTELARQAVGEDTDAELAAALILVRRRRIGGFRKTEAKDEMGVRLKEMGMMARAGFSRDVAQRALAMGMEEAERRIFALRTG